MKRKLSLVMTLMLAAGILAAAGCSENEQTSLDSAQTLTVMVFDRGNCLLYTSRCV